MFLMKFLEAASSCPAGDTCTPSVSVPLAPGLGGLIEVAGVIVFICAIPFLFSGRRRPPK